MGTNFYVLKPQPQIKCPHCGQEFPDLRETNREGRHIGKRSAAGLFCWDCNITLCIEGTAEIHNKSHFYTACPQCKRKPNTPNEGYQAAFVELGFQNPKEVPRPTGVSSASSFTWACSPIEVEGVDVIDEYGRIYTWTEFQQQVMTFCPIQYFHLIGVEFS